MSLVFLPEEEFPERDFYEPDPLGRMGRGKWVRRPGKSPYGRLAQESGFERFRKAWRDDASFPALFGTEPFRLSGRVARDGNNRRPDVAKVETFLERAGHLDLAPVEGPTGYFNTSTERAIRGYQTDNQLKVDGTINPDGETIRSLERGLGPVSQIENRATAITEAATRPELRDRFSGTITLRPVAQSLLPGAPLTADNRRKFEKRTGYTLSPTDEGVSLINPETGRSLAMLREDRAAELADRVDDYGDRIGLLELVDRDDISFDEKLRIATRMLRPVDPAEYAAARRHSPHSRARARAIAMGRIQTRDRLTETAWTAFHRAVQDLELGVPRDIAMAPLQKALFPELYDPQRVVTDFLKDAMLGLGSIRSFKSALNEGRLAYDAFDEGDWGEGSEHAVKGLIDAVGSLPALSSIKAGAKALPYGKAFWASGQLGIAGRRFHAINDKIDAEKLLGETFKNLPEKLKTRIRLTTANVYGAAGEKYISDLAKTIDSLGHRPGMVQIPKSSAARSGRRFFDYYHRALTDVMLDDMAAGYAKFMGKAAPAPRSGSHIEVKTGGAIKNKRQDYVDGWLLNNADFAAQQGVSGIRNYRVLPRELPIDFIVKDMDERFRKMVREKVLNPEDAALMLESLARQKASGVRAINALNYFGLMSRLGMSGYRNFVEEGMGQASP